MVTRLYLSCGILGATVMPHSLYLGSGIVQARLRDFDLQAGHAVDASAADPGQPRPSTASSVASDPEKYRPSLAAIRFCFRYSVVELAVSLFTFALFVNSSILVVAGASLHGDKGGAEAEDADLFAVHRLLSQTLAPVAGTIFALALLLSGVSAGIVCTISGQILSEGALRWTLRPWLRRLVTRAISIVPSIIIAAAVGRAGLGAALTASQVALSVILPFVSAPVIYFTCRSRYMTVAASSPSSSSPSSSSLPGGGSNNAGAVVNFRNHWFTAVFALVLWLVVTTMNVALLVLLGMGKA
jgi:metal iron transporter